MSEAPVVLLEERPTADGHILAVATLNNEKSLNSLSLEMIQILAPALARWAADARVVAVFLQGAGEKAFCAGGDVRRICLRVREHGIDDAYAREFFEQEYRLDYAIHRFPKPLIVWGQGIVMGGGIGLMSGASHRVVTGSSRLAMPEISIGLYPDVGGSYFLSRLPGRLGLFLGMTGANMNAADALYAGFATHALAEASRAAVLEGLCALAWSKDATQHDEQLSQFLAAQPAAVLPEPQILPRLELIEARSAGESLGAVYAGLTQAADDAWLNKAAQTLVKGSPTSAALIYRQWLRGRSLTLAEVFREELTLSVQCARHPDFIEGVRALLVDKDQSPRWQPTQLEDLSESWIAGHYQEPWSGPHPLADLPE